MNKLIGSLSQELILVNDSQDAKVVREHLGKSLTSLEEAQGENFNSFFVKTVEGDYAEVWGFEGIIPYNNKRAWRII